MPGHGNHWESLYDLDEVCDSIISRMWVEGETICRARCMDVKHETECQEEVVCLRHGNAPIANQLLLVTDSTEHTHYVFSGYPVVLDGKRYDLQIKAVRPWEYGIEGWVEGSVFGDLPVGLFDTMFFLGSDQLEQGQWVTYDIAALAYRMRAAEVMQFQISAGPLWMMEREERLARGESPEEASRPVDVRMDDAAVFLPGDDELCDEANVRGVVQRCEAMQHDGQTIYRVDVVVAKTDNGDFLLPVYVAERCLDGFVPKIGQPVEATVWIQGRRVGNVPGLAPERDAEAQNQAPVTVH
jgi:hypothetical protein